MDKTIMVVDDSKIAQLQLQRILSDSPYKVISCCQNGQEAVDQYPILKPDLITMDILMPEMDRLEAARKILTENPEAKILMIPPWPMRRPFRKLLFWAQRALSTNRLKPMRY